MRSKLGIIISNLFEQRAHVHSSSNQLINIELRDYTHRQGLFRADGKREMCLWTSAGLEKRQVRFRATEKREREKPELGMMLSNNNIIIRQVCV